MADMTTNDTGNFTSQIPPKNAPMAILKKTLPCSGRNHSYAPQAFTAAAKVNPVCRSAGGKRGSCGEEGQFRDVVEGASRCLTPPYSLSPTSAH